MSGARRTYAQVAGNASPTLDDIRRGVEDNGMDVTPTSSIDGEPHSRNLFSEEWSGESMEWTQSEENFYFLFLFFSFFKQIMKFQSPHSTPGRNAHGNNGLTARSAHRCRNGVSCRSSVFFFNFFKQNSNFVHSLPIPATHRGAVHRGPTPRTALHEPGADIPTSAD